MKGKADEKNTDYSSETLLAQFYSDFQTHYSIIIDLVKQACLPLNHVKVPLPNGICW